MSEINVAQPLLSEGCETVSSMGHLLGYARVSTTDQHPQLQVDALEACRLLSGIHRDRQWCPHRPPHPAQLLDQLRPGDSLVVWKLDRLGRSLRHLVDTVTGLADRARVPSLQEAIDTTTPGGKLVPGAAWRRQPALIVGVVATAAGLAARRAGGRHGRNPTARQATSLTQDRPGPQPRSLHGRGDSQDRWVVVAALGAVDGKCTADQGPHL